MRFYKYEGTVSQISSMDRVIILDDVENWEKAPVMLTVPCTGLHRYLETRGWTDDEERYLKQTFVYDGNLFLQAVVIHSSDPLGRPAKVIAAADPDRFTEEITVFGPEDLIDEADPDAMDAEEFHRWTMYRIDHTLPNV